MDSENTRKVANVLEIICCIVSIIAIIFFVFSSKGSYRSDEDIKIARRILKKLNEYDYPDIVKRDILNSIYDQNANFRRLEFLLRIFRYKEKKPVSNNEKIKAIKKINGYIKEEFIGNDEVVNNVILELRNNITFESVEKKHLCFLGPQGLGKTYLAELIAKSQDLCFGFISLNGLTDLKVLRGFSSTYVASTPGKIIGIIDKCKIKNPVIILDEIDKLDFFLQHGLLDILDSRLNDKFEDYFINLGYDLSKVQFILTANKEENIIPLIKDRLSFFRFKYYSQGEKETIAEFTVKKVLNKQYKIEKDLTSLYDKISLNTVVEKCFKGEATSIRNIRRVFEKIIKKRISSFIIKKVEKNENLSTIFSKDFNIKNIAGDEIDCNA